MIHDMLGQVKILRAPAHKITTSNTECNYDAIKILTSGDTIKPNKQQAMLKLQGLSNKQSYYRTQRMHQHT